MTRYDQNLLKNAKCGACGSPLEKDEDGLPVFYVLICRTCGTFTNQPSWEYAVKAFAEQKINPNVF